MPNVKVGAGEKTGLLGNFFHLFNHYRGIGYNMLTCASSGEILVAPPPKFFSTNTNGTSDPAHRLL